MPNKAPTTFSPTSKNKARYEPRLTQVLPPTGLPTNKRFSGMDKINLLGGRRLTQQSTDLNSPALRLLQKQKAEGKEDEDDFQSDDNTPMDPNLPKLKARRRVMYHLWKGNFERAKQYAEGQYLKARVGMEKAENDADYSAGHLDDIMQDFLMYAKCLMLSEGNIDTVRDILNVLSENVLSCIKINYKEVKASIEDANEGKEVKKPHAKDFDAYSMSAKSKTAGVHRRAETTDFSDIKRILHMHGIIAAMYKMLENQVEAEKTYAKYCKIVEKLFGIQSVEASNCYYYIGIYYYEEQQYEKALICMKKALFNRTKELGSKHVSCGDCHLNIGIIYKRLNQLTKAKAELEQALNIRREGIGKSSLQCAAVLEELGKLTLETGDYKSAFVYLQECYEIRKKLLKNPKNVEITRVSLLLIFLQRKMEKELRKTQDHERRQHDRAYALSAALNQANSLKSLIKGSAFGKIEDESPVTRGEDLLGNQQNIMNPLEAYETPIEEENKYMGGMQDEEQKSEEDYKGIGLQDFVTKGLNQIFKYHPEEPNTERIIDAIIFLLSLDKVQQDCLNKDQIDHSPNTPLYLTHEFNEKLSAYQRLIFSRAILHRLPRKWILKKPDGLVEPTNIKIMPNVRNHPILNTKENTTLSEKNIYKLIQSNSNFYRVLNSWQVEILNKVTSLQLPLGLFFRCIQESQLHSFEGIVQEELDALNDHELPKQSNDSAMPLFYKKEETKKDEISKQKLDPQTDMIDFVYKKLEREMLPKLVFDVSEEFCKNLNHDQLMQISQINIMKTDILKESADLPAEDKKNNWNKFISQLIEFLKSLNEKEAYHFSLANKFMIGIDTEHEIINEKNNKGSIDLLPLPNNEQKSETIKKEDIKEYDSNINRENSSENDEEEEEENEESNEEITALNEQEENNKLVQSVLQNPAILEEFKKTLPKDSLEMIVKNPEIIKHFLVKSPSGTPDIMKK